MKKVLILVGILVAVVMAICFCAGTSETTDQDQGKGSASQSSTASSKLGDYEVIIESCRLAEDYKGTPIVIIKYKFTNNDEAPSCFLYSVDDAVFQDGIGLNTCYVVADSANYSTENQTKEIKTGSSIYVEAAYVLNDTTTDIEVEVTEYISWNDDKITKTFSIK